jgi:starch phosphorylase
MYRFLPRKLPPQLEALTELALDLRWTWSHAGDKLWHKLDAGLWQKTQNPWVILQSIAPTRLEQLAADSAFCGELARHFEEHQRYFEEPSWYASTRMDASRRLGAIAYFSMEFGLGEAFPLYAGGLGVLAGDFLKTASDLAVPVVGIGLLYEEGYFRQVIDADGHQHESYPHNDPTLLPIQPAVDADDAWVKIVLQLPGRPLYLRVWQANVGRVHLYLLDSNDALNSPDDRGITAKLYPSNPELRFLQQIVLGIGGWTTLSRMGVDAEICHLNEAHTALALVERARRFMKKAGVSFREAWWATRAGNIFTTHTAVAAAFDAFPSQLIAKYSLNYLNEFGIPLRELLALGRSSPTDDDEPFKPAYLALRGCARTNAVSALHGKVSRKLFAPLFPRWPVDEVPITHITNGVHMPSWDSERADEIWTRACGKRRWHGGVTQLREAIAGVSDEALWNLAAETRGRLVRYARERLAAQLGMRGESPEHIAAARRVLDPNVLTLGFARRFAGYKRPNLLLSDAARLERLLLHARRPVQLIIAGKAHPDDERGKHLVHEWIRFIERPEIRDRAVFLADYDMALAQQLVQGVDVWINTPLRMLEACGTSGMKVLVNGGLNLSILDGWWAEAYREDLGWAIDGKPDSSGNYGDGTDAGELYRVLEDEIAPMFYERDSAGVARAWVQRMRASLSTLTPLFSGNRMLEEYVRTLYEPASADFRARVADGARLARELWAWESRVAANWHELHFGQIEARREGADWEFRVPVYLGGVARDAVEVELCAEATAEAPALRCPMRMGAAIAGANNGYMFGARVPASRPDWHYTPRIRARHPQAQIPAECTLTLWQR